VRREIEKSLIKNEITAEEISLIEDEIIEQYLDNELSKKHRSKFEKYFLVAQHRKVRLSIHITLRQMNQELAAERKKRLKSNFWNTPQISRKIEHQEILEEVKQVTLVH
jgi:hypothetical protein